MLGTSYTIVYTKYAGHKIRNSLYNIARVLALYKSYWAAMNKIFIYARPWANKMTWAYFLPGVVVAQEKTASFPQSVFSNCTVHDSVNIILNNQKPW